MFIGTESLSITGTVQTADQQTATRQTESGNVFAISCLQCVTYILNLSRY